MPEIGSIIFNPVLSPGSRLEPPAKVGPRPAGSGGGSLGSLDDLLPDPTPPSLPQSPGPTRPNRQGPQAERVTPAGPSVTVPTAAKPAPARSPTAPGSTAANSPPEVWGS